MQRAAEWLILSKRGVLPCVHEPILVLTPFIRCWSLFPSVFGGQVLPSTSSGSCCANRSCGRQDSTARSQDALAQRSRPCPVSLTCYQSCRLGAVPRRAVSSTAW